jgi:hypothetical protein
MLWVHKKVRITGLTGEGGDVAPKSYSEGCRYKGSF